MMKKFFLMLSFLLFVVSSHAVAEEIKPHHQNAGLNCIACHGTDDPLDPAEESQCLICHQSRDKVAELTAQLEPNPHFGHEDGLACHACHKEHEASVMYCDQCHNFGYVTP